MSNLLTENNNTCLRLTGTAELKQHALRSQSCVTKTTDSKVGAGKNKQLASLILKCRVDSPQERIRYNYTCIIHIHV